MIGSLTTRWAYCCFILHNFRKRPLTAAELLEEIENITNGVAPDDIYIFPPEDHGWETDGDSGDEDCNDPNRLNSNQLQSQAEAEFRNASDSLESSDDEIIEQEVDQPPIKKTKPNNKKRNWENGDMEVGVTRHTNEVKLPLLTLSGESEPLEFFELFFSPDVVELLVKYTVMYASTKNYRLELGNDEMYAFVAILYLSGYVPVPRRRMYWETRDDTHNLLASNSMRRNRFEEIFRFIHAADNSNLVANDRFSKLRPLMNKLNNIFIRYAPISSNLSIDESMIPYFGRNGCKQFIKGKPIRFGYKAWVLALPSGYCINFDVYQGRKNQESNGEKLGLGASVVMNFAKTLEKEFSDIPFSLFFDNFFTSASLITALGELGFGGTGTVRENRTEKCMIESTAAMKKKARGVYDSAVDKENNIVCVKWKDNSIVTMLSNEYGVLPVCKASRYSVKEKKKVEIPQPNVIHKYNSFMGGVDQMDNNVANYRIGFRGKKWYIPILFWTFDVCMSNAWILCRQYGKKIDNLEFRRSVVLALLQKYGKMPRATGPKSSFVSPASLSSGQHLIITQQSRRRCVVCKNKTTKACERCTVALHDKCFADYHKTT